MRAQWTRDRGVFTMFNNRGKFTLLSPHALLTEPTSTILASAAASAPASPRAAPLTAAEVDYARELLQAMQARGDADVRPSAVQHEQEPELSAVEKSRAVRRAGGSRRALLEIRQILPDTFCDVIGEASPPLLCIRVRGLSR